MHLPETAAVKVAVAENVGRSTFIVKIKATDQNDRDEVEFETFDLQFRRNGRLLSENNTALPFQLLNIGNK